MAQTEGIYLKKNKGIRDWVQNLWINPIEKHLSLLVFFGTFIIQIPMLFGRFDYIDRIKYFSMDEYVLVKVILRYQAHLVNGDLIALFAETMDYGYGFVFYLSYAILTLPFSMMDGELGVLAGGRFISAIFQSLTFVWIVKLAKRFTPSAPFLLFFGLILALTPIFLILHKPLSAEQLSIFLLVLAAVKLFNENTQTLNLRWVAFFVGLSISIKFNGVLEGLFFALMTIYILLGRKKSTIEVLKEILIFGAIVLIVFLAANTPILFSSASRTDFFDWLFLQFASTSNSQGGAVFYSGIGDWFSTIKKYAGSLWFSSILIGTLGGLSLVFLNLKRKDLALKVFLLFLWVVMPTAFCLLLVKKAWIWYLALPVIFAFMALPILNGLPYTKTERHFSSTLKISLSILSYVLLFTHFIYASKDYGYLMEGRLGELSQPRYIEMVNITNIMEEKARQENYGVVYSDNYATLPQRALKREGTVVRNGYPFQHTLPNLLKDKPGLILVNYSGYKRNHNQRPETIAEFEALLSSACEQDLCYEKFYQGVENDIVVYERTKLPTE